jgi:hypothetical protein
VVQAVAVEVLSAEPTEEFNPIDER